MFLDYRKEPECVDESKKRNSMRSADKSGSEHTKERTELIISNLWKVRKSKSIWNQFIHVCHLCSRVISYLILSSKFNLIFIVRHIIKK